MARRCKPGQRARIIARSNKGTVVLVVRPYFGGDFAGSTWPQAIFGWIVTSLGESLRTFEIDTGKECPPRRSIAIDDSDLEPIDDDDFLDDDQVAREKPVGREKVAVNDEEARRAALSRH